MRRPFSFVIPARVAPGPKPYVRWGFYCEPTMSDPRQIEYRLHQEQGKPTAIELYVRLRTYEHQADTPQSLRFPWPTEKQAVS